MGQLVNGEWQSGPVGARAGEGDFRRPDAVFRNWITPDGKAGPSGEGGFPAEADRYHLYVSYACPWAHRALIFRELNGLVPLIGVSVVHPLMGADGWTFDSDFPGATGDLLHGAAFLRDVYLRADPRMTGKVTVPLLWDRQQDRIVSNESSEIIRMFDSAFDAITGNRDHYWPEALRPKIEPINARVYDTLNNGVYKAGFATTQAAYDAAVAPLFDTLDWLEALLGRSRYLTGERLTEALRHADSLDIGAGPGPVHHFYEHIDRWDTP